MNFEIHTLYYKNSDPIFFEFHSKIMKKFNIPIQYTNETINVGSWMNKVMKNSKSDIVGFIDIDCVVTNKDIIKKCLSYVQKKKSMIGIALVANHISPYTHIYVGPTFCFIDRKTWINVGRPSFGQLKSKLKNTFRTKYDYAEKVSYVFEKKKIRYKALYPMLFDKIHKEYYLHNYGMYGIGTYYEGGVYHLFESRLNENTKIFEKRCKEILNDTFTTEGMINSRSFK